jgi:hypothetical protein
MPPQKRFKYGMREAVIVMCLFVFHLPVFGFDFLLCAGAAERVFPGVVALRFSAASPGELVSG